MTCGCDAVIEHLVDETNRLKEALEFYADRRIYSKPVVFVDPNYRVLLPETAEEDQGERARVALRRAF